MRKAAYFFCLMVSMSLRSVQAQSGPMAATSSANEMTASSLPSQTSNTVETSRLPHAQQFICTVGITLEKCQKDMSVLRRLLANYPASELGEWKWVLVPSDYWRLFLIGRGFNSSVPALTALDARTTFFEEALIAGPSGRISELTDIWHADRNGLLDLAIRHELGHALCSEENERQADRVARLLENKEPVSCKGTRRQSRSSTVTLH
jgi:hypothetical protein